MPLAELCGTKLSPMEYLVQRFEAVQPVETAEHAWFDTGMLFAETGRPIFAYFERNIHANMQPWFFWISGRTRRSRRAGAKQSSARRFPGKTGR